MPAGVKIITPNPEAVLVKAVPALTEDQLKALDEASKVVVAADKVESAAPKKKEDGDEAAAGGADKKAAPTKK